MYYSCFRCLLMYKDLIWNIYFRLVVSTRWKTNNGKSVFFFKWQKTKWLLGSDGVFLRGFTLILMFCVRFSDINVFSFFNLRLQRWILHLETLVCIYLIFSKFFFWSDWMGMHITFECTFVFKQIDNEEDHRLQHKYFILYLDADWRCHS